MAIAFDCASCGKHFEVKEELAGRRAKCSGCKAVILIPQPALVASAEHRLAASDDDYRLASVFDEEFGPASDENKPSETSPCPSCAEPLNPTDVLCVHCGFHLKKRKKIRCSQEEKADAQSQKVLPRRKPNQRQGRKDVNLQTFLRGALLSLTGALLGGGIWTAIALTTGYSVGFLAWAIGGLAGLGMLLGHDNEGSVLAGITASVMALVGCVFGKVLWFAFIIGAIGSTIDGYEHEYVASIVAEESIRLQGIAPDEVDEDRLDAEIEKMMPVVQSWSDQQIAERVELYEAADRGEAYQILFNRELSAISKQLSELNENEAQTIYQKIGPQVATMSDQEIVTLLREQNRHSEAAAEIADRPVSDEQSAASLFSLVMVSFLAFGIFGGIFLILGMITAYRVGSGQLAS